MKGLILNVTFVVFNTYHEGTDIKCKSLTPTMKGLILNVMFVVFNTYHEGTDIKCNVCSL